VSEQTLTQLLTVDDSQWRAEMRHLGEYFAGFGERLPSALAAEHQRVSRALGEA
jgi:GTP-dependent phosphoenolpyruvate carboxykinase